MKNIQIVDGADNATFSIFQATDDEFAKIFPGDGQDIELIEDVISRLGEEALASLMSPIWERPIHKRDVVGIHGTLFYGHERKRHHLPITKREVDRIRKSTPPSAPSTRAFAARPPPPLPPPPPSSPSWR